MNTRDLALSFLAGVLVFIALSLLINPDVAGAHTSWGTFYGAF